MEGKKLGEDASAGETVVIAWRRPSFGCLAEVVDRAHSFLLHPVTELRIDLKKSDMNGAMNAF